MKAEARGRIVLASAAAIVLLASCGGGGGSATTQEVAAPEPLSANSPFALSDGTAGDKPKIQRASDGTLVVAYGDAPDSNRKVYDVKANAERPARDIFVKTCKPDATKTCNAAADWSAAVNVSQSSAKSSISTQWGGASNPAPMPFPGDIDKPNIKTSGPVMVLTWVSKYCTNADGSTPSTTQRAIRYLERDSRVIPFSCVWTSYSINNGTTWSAPRQLSDGTRDAIQDSSAGSFSTTTKTGQFAISWQEDPEGVQLGEADGPGDGASGAYATAGTDVWYAYANVNLSVPATPSDDFVLSTPVRLTDNWLGQFGLSGQVVNVFDANGNPVDPNTVDKGNTAASRPNIGMVGTTAIVAYEETKGSEGLDEGKFVRYMAFNFAAPPRDAANATYGTPGCLISNPAKNARRVRFLTQSATDAGPGGVQIAVFWKEGVYDKGGPADIMVRRGMGGLQPANMVPAVDGACATSDYATALALQNAPAENISSRAPTVTSADTGLADDSEANYTENALAHRGVLRGGDLWIGYSYTSDLVKLWAQQDNYNFWVRKYTFDPATATGGWGLPMNVSNITDKRINVREPRIIGTPKSSLTACPTGNASDPTTTDPTLCQNPNVFYIAWGTQENVSPYDPQGGEDLGIYITASTNGGTSYFEPIRFSTAKGALFDDTESAYESQVVTRPDGGVFYGVWNQANATSGSTVAEFASGQITSIAAP